MAKFPRDLRDFACDVQISGMWNFDIPIPFHLEQRSLEVSENKVTQN